MKVKLSELTLADIFKWNTWELEVLSQCQHSEFVHCEVVTGPHCPMGITWDFHKDIEVDYLSGP